MFKERVFHLVSSGLDLEVLCAKTVERNNAENLKYLIPGQEIQFNSIQFSSSISSALCALSQIILKGRSPGKSRTPPTLLPYSLKLASRSSHSVFYLNVFISINYPIFLFTCLLLHIPFLKMTEVCKYSSSLPAQCDVV